MRKQSVLTFCVLTLAILASLPASAAQIAAVPAPIPVPPDLTATGLQILAPTTLHCGMQTVTFRVNENNGGGSSGPFYLDLQYDYGSGSTFWAICRYSRPGLGALSTRVLGPINCTFWNGPCDCLPTTYTATFRVFIDSLNNVAESNEGNNLSNTVSIPAACP